MPGNFHTSARDIELEHGHKLKCILRNNGGVEVESKINLNDYIGNSDGALPPSNPPLLFLFMYLDAMARLVQMGRPRLLRLG